MFSFRSAFFLFLPFFFALVSNAQVVSVQKVKFTSLQNDWFLSEVEISTGRNTLPGAVSGKFIEEVGVRLYLGFENRNIPGGIDYYYSEVTALILEKGDKNTVRFFMPDKELEMNRYNKPEYYYAELVVNESPLSPKARAFSSKFQNEESLDSFVEKAMIGSIENYGRLMPSYLAPNSVVGNDLDAPAYLRANNFKIN